MTSPIKYNFKSEIFPLFLVCAALILGFYFYSHFPEKVVTHWNYAGEADGYGGRAAGAFAVPAMLAVMYFLFLFLPYFDPKKERYADFSEVYLKFRTAIIFCLFAVFSASGLYNLGFNIPIGKTVSLVIGLLMIFLGNLMGKLKKNWFVGIRTPWTLSSENVWNKTHRFGGFAFVIFGLLIIITPYLGKTLGLAAFIGGALLAVIGSIGYSYLAYRQERKKVVI